MASRHLVFVLFIVDNCYCRIYLSSLLEVQVDRFVTCNLFMYERTDKNVKIVFLLLVLVPYTFIGNLLISRIFYITNSQFYLFVLMYFMHMYVFLQ